MTSTRYEQVRTSDGVFDAFCAEPDVRPAPAVVLFQEIFGINDNIRGLAAVSYYGSGVAQRLELLDAIECPMLFHYGDDDPYIPADQVAAVEQAVAGRPDMTLHRYPAGHAFSNWDAPSMYDEPAATLAWERTLAFFGTHLTRR